MNTSEKKTRIIGLMSGTSLDGLDIVCVDFWEKEAKIQWEFIATDCISYSAEWENKLRTAHTLPADKLLFLDASYGKFLGQRVNEFIEKFNLKKIDFVASHGQTIFHQPEKGFTLQIGHGAHIQAKTNLKVISDFRSQDVALNGQGAPLVPIGDQLLFSEYDACINLGGFANISFEFKEKRIAFDVCPVNFVINHLCQKIDLAFDNNGKIAKNGKVDSGLFQKLNKLSFYKESFPKSLGREWVVQEVLPITDGFNISTEDKIATFTEHVSYQITNVLNTFNLNKILFTGGGTKNKHLIHLIQEKTQAEIICGNHILIDFKEALVFALLGYLKAQNKVNTLASVTGATRDSSGGILYI